MKTILSIDLNVLMAPYVNSYVQFIMSKNKRQNWKIIDEVFDISDFTINHMYKNIIIDVINNYKDKVDKIYIGDEHSKILSVFEENVVDFNDLTVYNIDNNHDINYAVQDGLPDKPIERKLTELASSHWAGLCLFKGGKYKWYRCKGSGIGKAFFERLSAVKLKNFESSLIEDGFPMDLDIDGLFISTSWDFIPKHCEDEVVGILSMIEDDKKIILE